MFFSIDDRGECLPMVYHWPSDKVDIIVVTDGSRILGFLLLILLIFMNS